MMHNGKIRSLHHAELSLDPTTDEQRVEGDHDTKKSCEKASHPIIPASSRLRASERLPLKRDSTRAAPSLDLAEWSPSLSTSEGTEKSKTSSP
jgi:hypothetical protein